MCESLYLQLDELQVFSHCGNHHPVGGVCRERSCNWAGERVHGCMPISGEDPAQASAHNARAAHCKLGVSTGATLQTDGLSGASDGVAV